MTRRSLVRALARLIVNDSARDLGDRMAHITYISGGRTRTVRERRRRATAKRAPARFTAAGRMTHPRGDADEHAAE